MNWRLGFLLCCAALTAMAATTVANGQEAAWICCESSGSCPGTQLCCDPESLGVLPCSDEAGNYCMEVCKRVGFTPDQQ
jgi:hypothetical protein